MSWHTRYPRPQMRRDSFLPLLDGWTLNGNPIKLPFCPESLLSGYEGELGDTMTYETTFTLPKNFVPEGQHVLLHFGAVDQIAEVFLNGRPVVRHEGGYLPFFGNITKLLVPGENTLTVLAIDALDHDYPYGKQTKKRGGMWYTPVTGIWQTVWLEAVPQQYISRLRITPLFDEAACLVTALSEADAAVCVTLGTQQFTGRSNEPIRLQLPADFRAWSPEDPYLYPFSVQLGEDSVQSYFGMRKFSCEFDEKGVRRLFLNGKPYFHNGVLDQGYWPDGLYTAPTDEALIFDIQTMKTMGFNTLRKHIKVESARWYYHCDRLGMLVWQDMPCGGGETPLLLQKVPVALSRLTLRDSAYRAFARDNAEGRAQYYRALREMLEQLYNVTSLAVWVPFNEGWGQFDAAKAHDLVKQLDATRTVDHASGWYDQGVGELLSLHIYFKPVTMQRDSKKRAFCVTEFGGLTLGLEGHTFNRKQWGYFRSADTATLAQDFRKLYRKQIIPLTKKGLAAAIYTQLSDVEGEVNGLITYDREVIKIDPAAVREAITPQ